MSNCRAALLKIINRGRKARDQLPSSLHLGELVRKPEQRIRNRVVWILLLPQTFVNQPSQLRFVRCRVTLPSTFCATLTQHRCGRGVSLSVFSRCHML